MPAELVSRISGDTREAVMDDALYKQLVSQGSQPVGGSPAQLAELIRRDSPVWRELVRKSGAKSE